MAITNKYYQAALACALLVLATLAVYWPVIHFELINYDDTVYVSHNQHVLRGLSWQGTGWAFQTGHAGNWHPLTWLSHMLDAQLFGLRAGGHHLTNLLFHVANTLFLFLVFKRMTGALWRCAFVAALFALHPLHVESVAWVAERKDVLSTFFGLLCLWEYARYVQKSEVRDQKSESRVPTSDLRPLTSPFYWLALLFFTLSLMSKPMLVTLPFLLLLLDYWPLRRLSHPAHQHCRTSPLRLVLEKLPFFALAAASSVITFFAQQRVGAVASLENISMGMRVMTAVMAYFSYLAKTFWPRPLAVFYPYRADWHIGIVVLTGFFLLALSVVSLLAGRQRPWLIVGWFWFLGALVPVIGLVQVGAQALADRYTYLPLIGIFIIIAWESSDLLKRWRCQQAGLAALGVTAVAACIIATSFQLSHWKNTETLCRHALRVTTDNFAAHASLGAALLEQGKTEAAKAEFARTLELHPQHAVANYVLGTVLARENKPEEAIGHFETALRIDPLLVEAHTELANLLIARGQADAGMTHALKALALDPDFPDAHFNVGGALLLQGKLREALPHYEAALKLSPDYAEAHLNCGKALLNLGKLEEAEIHLREARRLQPDNIETHRSLAAVYSGLNRSRDQAHEYAEMLRLAPDWPEVLNNLAWLLATHPSAEIRNGAEAVPLAERACALTSRTNLWLLSTLAAAYAEAGKFPDAVSTQQKVCDLAAAQTNSGPADSFKQRLELYRSGNAYHKP